MHLIGGVQDGENCRGAIGPPSVAAGVIQRYPRQCRCHIGSCASPETALYVPAVLHMVRLKVIISDLSVTERFFRKVRSVTVGVASTGHRTGRCRGVSVGLRQDPSLCVGLVAGRHPL